MFRFARWLQMRVENEIVAGFETPGEAVGFGVRRAAGLPEEEMAGRIEDVGFDVEIHAREAEWFFARGAGAVDDHVRVMHKAFIARADFDGANVAGRGNVRSEDEIPEDVGSAGGERVTAAAL